MSRAPQASKLLANLAAVDDFDRPVARRHQLLVGDDAQLVIDRRGQVGRTDRVFSGSEAVEFDAPKIEPRLMPPPASTTLNTLGQWSRPAVPLIFGVRPNSLETMTSVSFEQAGAVQVADQRGERLVEGRHAAAACRR